jgi:integrase/recombinase XerD
LRICGVKKAESMVPELTSKECSRCEKINGPTSKFCSHCGMVLSLEAAKEVQEYEQKLPEILQLS